MIEVVSAQTVRVLHCVRDEMRMLLAFSPPVPTFAVGMM